MTIKKIKIENVRGIDRLEICEDVYANKPNIIVAANGFGKTSIATAFKCLAEQTYIKLPEDSRHAHDDRRKASVCIEFEENSIRVSNSASEDARSNEIRKSFDIHVISDPRRIKASSRKFGGFSAATARQVIDPIVVCERPKEVPSPYSIRAMRADFGNHSRVLSNLESVLFSLSTFIARSIEFMEAVLPLAKERKWRKLDALRLRIGGNVGSAEDAIAAALPEILALLSDDDFKHAASILYKTAHLSPSDAFLAIWQVVTLCRKNVPELEGYFLCLRYKEVKSSLKNHISDLNWGWKEAVVKESGGQLLVEMPDPTHLSNGQRDIILLASMFHAARCRLTKKKAIVIVDEVFDYLDDANLTVAQFYISELIDDFRRQGRLLYPILLTHLNPAFFKNYVFSDQKVIYLDGSHSYKATEPMKRLIAARSDSGVPKALKDKISKCLVHYYVGAFDFSVELGAIKDARTSWGKGERFQEFLMEEFEKYKKGDRYCPLAICAVTRRAIEALAYAQIAHMPDADQFFEEKKTVNKLRWAAKRGACVPEVHYLLRIVFDDGLHWSQGRDNTIPIVAKLGNPIIKKLVIQAASDAFS